MNDCDPVVVTLLCSGGHWCTSAPDSQAMVHNSLQTKETLTRVKLKILLPFSIHNIADARHGTQSMDEGCVDISTNRATLTSAYCVFKRNTARFRFPSTHGYGFYYNPVTSPEPEL